MTETIRAKIPVAEYEGTRYTDWYGFESVVNQWVTNDPRRAAGGDEDLALTYWDEKSQRQQIDVRSDDTDVAAKIGFGWSLHGLPFDIEAVQTLGDLDGTDDAPAWLQTGYVLDAHDVAFIRGLVLPDPLVIRSEE